MIKQEVTIIKMGGSLITYKQDKQLIDLYLDEIDHFIANKGSFNQLTKRIISLMNFDQINRIYLQLKKYIDKNPQEKFILIHGAGSIGHSLVLRLIKRFSGLQNVYPLIKLSVNIQNEILVASAINIGIPAIPMSSYQLMSGISTEEISTHAANAQDLAVVENILHNSNAIPIFFGDIGYTEGGWRVFSGDIVPTTLMTHFKSLKIKNALFLTSVNDKKTGIYTKDPIHDDSIFISRIIVNDHGFECYSSENKRIRFDSGFTNGEFDVTGSMEGKFQNLLKLSRSFIKCWVIGAEDLEQALHKEDVGTTVQRLYDPRANIVFLGTGDAFAANGNKSAGVFIEINNSGILLDCGPHTIQALKKSGRTSNDVDIILITHYHGDHIGGLPFLLLDATLQQYRIKPLKIIGPSGIKEKVYDLFKALYGSLANEKLPFACEFTVITPGIPIYINGASIKAFNMFHVPESQGYRLEFKNIIISYTGDTGWTENLIPLMKNSDLTITECSFYEEEFDAHLNYHQIKKLISHTKKIALIHMGIETIKNRNVISTNANILLPFDGQEIQF